MDLEYSLCKTLPGIKLTLEGPRWWPWYWPELVGPGVKLTVTGPRGCGKTTLCDAATKLIHRHGGKVLNPHSRDMDTYDTLVATLGNLSFHQFSFGVKTMATRMNLGMPGRDLTRGLDTLHLVRGERHV